MESDRTRASLGRSEVNFAGIGTTGLMSAFQSLLLQEASRGDGVGEPLCGQEQANRFAGPKPVL